MTTATRTTTTTTSGSNGTARTNAAAPPPPPPTPHPPATPAGRRRRTELAAFLRGRRARVTPADVGMPPGPRRRTPGLRREEVAQLSGVGVTWYTWLEQGRPINASPQVLDAVARTLRLDTAEREHLYHLAEVPYTASGAVCEAGVGKEIQDILDALGARPAVVYNDRYDILACNAVYRRIFLPNRLPEAPLNALWTLFTVPEEKCPLKCRNDTLPTMVATLRSNYGRHLGEPAWEHFIHDLAAASEDFRHLWENGDVLRPGPRVKTFRHAAVGEMRLTSVSMSVDGMCGSRMVVYTPADEETAGAMEALRDREISLWPAGGVPAPPQ